MGRTHGEGAASEGAGRRSLPGDAVVYAVLLLMSAAALLLSTGEGGPGRGEDGEGEPAAGSVTVPPLWESELCPLPSTWLQPRNSSAGTGVWGPDVTAPLDTLWRLRSGFEFFGAPALCDSVLYLGGNDGRFLAVDAGSGSVLWTYNTACGICGEPAVTGTTVFFGGQDGYLYALDRVSGSLIWSAGLGFHIFASVGVLADSAVVTGNSDGSVAALSAADGGVLWSHCPGGVVLGPALADTMAVFTTEDGVVAAYGLSGREAWKRDFPAQASAPSIVGSDVLVGFSDGTVRSLDLATGSALWETDLTSQPGRTVLSRPVASTRGILVGTCDGRVVCLSDSTGGEVWEAEFENWVQVAPAAGSSAVYVSSDDRRLHILDASDGTALAVFEMGGYSGTAPIVANGVIFLGTTSGDFLALRGTPLEAPEEP